jgi:hypothetical protein
MRHFRKIAVVILVAVVSFAATPVAQTQECGLGSVWDGTYYSDYFQTVNGWYVNEEMCGGPYQSGGTLDGLYFEWARTNCECGHGAGGCKQKVNGVWQTIACPWD